MQAARCWFSFAECAGITPDTLSGTGSGVAQYTICGTDRGDFGSIAPRTKLPNPFFMDESIYTFVATQANGQIAVSLVKDVKLENALLKMNQQIDKTIPQKIIFVGSQPVGVFIKNMGIEIQAEPAKPTLDNLADLLRDKEYTVIKPDTPACG